LGAGDAVAAGRVRRGALRVRSRSPSPWTGRRRRARYGDATRRGRGSRARPRCKRGGARRLRHRPVGTPTRGQLARHPGRRATRTGARGGDRGDEGGDMTLAIRTRWRLAGVALAVAAALTVI